MTEWGFAFRQGCLDFFFFKGKGEVNLTISFYFESVSNLWFLILGCEKKKKIMSKYSYFNKYPIGGKNLLNISVLLDKKWIQVSKV